ncbi:MAG: hypothetical protein ACI9U2_004753 [Bradymonadia bacterium]|jgi:hypothetical protein
MPERRSASSKRLCTPQQRLVDAALHAEDLTREEARQPSEHITARRRRASQNVMGHGPQAVPHVAGRLAGRDEDGGQPGDQPPRLQGLRPIQRARLCRIPRRLLATPISSSRSPLCSKSAVV